MTTLVSSVVLALLIIAVYESGVLLEGGMTGDANAEFLTMMTMELLTVCAIPVSLRLFRFEAVKRYIATRRERGHYRMALTRMALLVVPMLVNLMCYYMFVKVAFAYLALILAISLVFIIPTKNRCASEL